MIEKYHFFIKYIALIQNKQPKVDQHLWIQTLLLLFHSKFNFLKL